jgi:nifR3 family TIM-barrel protein
MRSPLNENVPLARPGEFAPLRLGPLTVDPPVVLAPMAGVTNAPFRTLCRRFSGQRCLYVSEMITARAFAVGHQKTLRLASFGPDEATKSIQLYGTQPEPLGAAAKILAEEWGVDHIDINLGCPVRKVTSIGGGSAIPVKPKLMARLVGAVVGNAGRVPVTVKFRKGIDDSLLTYLDAGRVAEDVGCRAVALHARTAAQLYSGEADWSAIASLKQAVKSIPVLGNGDVFEAFDALRMMRETGCDGVVVGRGCLGRPWLFRDLVDAFDGKEPEAPPTLGAIAALIGEHARLLAAFFDERVAILHMRRFACWYTKCFPGSARLHPRIQQLCTLADLDALLAELPRDLPFPREGLRVKRGKSTGVQTVALPDGYLATREDDRAPCEAAELVGEADALSGG